MKRDSLLNFAEEDFELMLQLAKRHEANCRGKVTFCNRKIQRFEFASGRNQSLSRYAKEDYEEAKLNKPIREFELEEAIRFKDKIVNAWVGTR